MSESIYRTQHTSYHNKKIQKRNITNEPYGTIEVVLTSHASVVSWTSLSFMPLNIAIHLKVSYKDKKKTKPFSLFSFIDVHQVTNGLFFTTVIHKH